MRKTKTHAEQLLDRIKELDTENKELVEKLIDAGRILAAAEHDRDKAQQLTIQLQKTNKALEGDIYKIKAQHHDFVRMAKDTISNQAQILTKISERPSAHHIFEEHIPY